MPLRHNMTKQEALCFHALRRWQRVHIWQDFKASLHPKALFAERLSKQTGCIRLMTLALMLLSAPLWLAWGLFHITLSSLALGPELLATYINPPGLRAPGERNIKGLHYQFARYIHLPPDLYIRCVDDWVAILYGPDKWPRYSLKHYLNTDYLYHRRVGLPDNDDLQALVQSQISNAREELSNDLGHY
ncbi:hypothetical protein [Agaribacterium sp. ZY112]|uniref:hypothetical protein n=1 Tax=Agaribacterium sp. ZY112 TaxID=3233574 RepID=UPI0035252008